MERRFAALADRASVIEAPAAERERSAEPGRLMLLADRYGLMPAVGR